LKDLFVFRVFDHLIPQAVGNLPPTNKVFILKNEPHKLNFTDLYLNPFSVV